MAQPGAVIWRPHAKAVPPRSHPPFHSLAAPCTSIPRIAAGGPAPQHPRPTRHTHLGAAQVSDGDGDLVPACRHLEAVLRDLGVDGKGGWRRGIRVR